MKSWVGDTFNSQPLTLLNDSSLVSLSFRYWFEPCNKLKIYLTRKYPIAPAYIPWRDFVGVELDFPPEVASKSSDADHDDLLPTSRDTRHRHRPPARRTGRAESVLYCLQIMGAAIPSAPFRSCRVHIRLRLQIMDGGLSRSIDLSRSLRSNP